MKQETSPKHHHHESTECRHLVSAATKERLLLELGRILPAEALLHQPEDLRYVFY